MWEESPIGDWTLEVVNDGRTSVELKNWSVAFYGTKNHPQKDLKSGLPESIESSQKGLPASVEPIELNQVPKVPEQQTADVTKLHQGKQLKGLDSEEIIIPGLSDPSASGIPAALNLPHCSDSEIHPDLGCSKCESGFLLQGGHCVESCPAEGFYVGQENHQDSCIQCYYTCKSCDGPNDYQVSFLFLGSKAHLFFCILKFKLVQNRYLNSSLYWFNFNLLHRLKCVCFFNSKLLDFLAY
jgi:hypothetical protein